MNNKEQTHIFIKNKNLSYIDKIFHTVDLLELKLRFSNSINIKKHTMINHIDKESFMFFFNQDDGNLYLDNVLILDNVSDVGFFYFEEDGIISVMYKIQSNGKEQIRGYFFPRHLNKNFNPKETFNKVIEKSKSILKKVSDRKSKDWDFDLSCDFAEVIKTGNFWEFYLEAKKRSLLDYFKEFFE